MVPEGVLTTMPGGFRIYLQNNFDHLSGIRLRERFTLAHELVHTFFYDVTGEKPRPAKGSPKGKRLEYLCHAGAAQILVPDALLRDEVMRGGRVASIEGILKLASLFRVSVEVMMRRLHATELIDVEHFAAVLVDATKRGKPTIQAACFGPLLLCCTTPPKRGLDFDSWLGPLSLKSKGSRPLEWTRDTPAATVTARTTYRSERSFFLEITFAPPTTRRT
jgi:IrrE N-terminal-like domain